MVGVTASADGSMPFDAASASAAATAAAATGAARASRRSAAVGVFSSSLAATAEDCTIGEVAGGETVVLLIGDEGGTGKVAAAAEVVMGAGGSSPLASSASWFQASTSLPIPKRLSHTLRPARRAACAFSTFPSAARARPLYRCAFTQPRSSPSAASHVFRQRRFSSILYSHAAALAKMLARTLL